MSRYPRMPLLLLTACLWILTTPVHANVDAEEQPQRFPQTTPGPPPDVTLDVEAMKKVFAETEQQVPQSASTGARPSPFSNNPQFIPLTPQGDPEVTASALSSGAPSGTELTSPVPNEAIKRDPEHGKLLGATPQEYKDYLLGDSAGVRALAEQGSPVAQYDLGIIYHSGWGVPEDFAKALHWFRLAANQGMAGAQYMTGRMFNYGQGVAQDYQEALKWYRLAAAQSLAASQGGMGFLYFLGHGVPQNYAEAAKWFRLAAEQGDLQAKWGLGLLYETGRGVPEDYVQAHVWYNLAAAQNNEKAKEVAKLRDQIGEKMTHEQIAEAQRLAREWLAHHHQK